VHYPNCSADTLEREAAALARAANSPMCIFLHGDLGAGKTTFARAFIRAYFACSSLQVPSPTFTIVQTYSSKDCARDSFTHGAGGGNEAGAGDEPGAAPRELSVWHVDLYRVDCVEDVWALGLHEAIHEHICLIEWPNLLKEANIAGDIEVFLTVRTQEARDFVIHTTRA
jgi:tRNA A37 threonylcarbamoyladenosine biosynthesis protein TsaE